MFIKKLLGKLIRKLVLIAGKCNGGYDFYFQNDDGTTSIFYMVGYLKNDTLRGFTFFCDYPTRKSIKAFEREMRSRFQKFGNRILKVHIYDSRRFTPDVTMEYYFPEWSDPYLAADFYHNPFNKQSGLKIHKVLAS